MPSRALKGTKNPGAGKYKKSEEQRRKIRESNKGKHAGILNPWWQGGIWHNPYPEEWKDDIKEAIRKRDNYICQLCGIHQDELKGWQKKLNVHHKDYIKDNLNPDNLISLCRSCHTKTNHNRNYWIKYFENKLSKKL